jgi:hypothetical protein
MMSDSEEMVSTPQMSIAIPPAGCCAGASAFSKAEYRRYCRATGSEYSIAPISSAPTTFGDGNSTANVDRLRSTGTAVNRGHRSALEFSFSFKAHITLDADTRL